MNYIRRLASDTMWYGLSSIISRIVMFVILSPYIYRILTVEDQGVYRLMYVLAAMLIPFFTFRMETAFFRYGSLFEVHKAFWSGVLFIGSISLILACLLILNDSQIATFISQAGDERFVWYVTAITILDALATIPFAYLRLEGRPRKFAFIKILNIILTVICVFSFIEGLPRYGDTLYYFFGQIVIGNDTTILPFSAESKIDYLILANLIASAITLLLLFPIFLKLRFELEKRILMTMLYYATPLVVVGVAAVINQVTDRLLIKHWVPGDEVERIKATSIYTGATTLAVIMNLFTQAYNYAAEPFFFKNAEEANARTIYARSTEAFFLCGFIGFVLISMNLFWIKYYLPPHFWEAVPLTPLLLMSYLLLGLYYNLSIWYKVTDKTIYGGLISVIGAGITLGLNYILIPRIGIIGAATTSLIVYCIMCLLSYGIGRKHYCIQYKTRRLILPFIIFGLYMTYFILFEKFAFNLSWVTCCVHLVIILATITFLAWKEKQFIQQLFHRKHSF